MFDGAMEMAESRRVIVTLTTYPARLVHVKRVLAPIFCQTVQPDEVQLWLSRDQFSPIMNDVEDELSILSKLGAVIKWCEDDIGPHKKYFWVMQENPNDIVITIDDDVVYPLTLVQDLLDEHYRWPTAVVANRTHIVRADETGKILPYASWDFEQREFCGVPRRELVATGVGGILYPPRVFDAPVFDLDAIKQLAPFADDLWLMVHELRLGIPVVSTKRGSDLFYIPGSQETGLFHENLERGGNDAVLGQLFERYPETASLLSLSLSRKEASISQGGSDGSLPFQRILSFFKLR